LLIAAGATAGDTERIPQSVRLLIEASDQIMVIAPELPTRAHWLVSDTDKARMAADDRLATVLGELRELGQEAGGAVAADDPLLAFSDAIEDFHPDHLLVALRGPHDAGWQEHGLLEAVLKRFGLPITVFVA
jgi:hypothetical protein